MLLFLGELALAQMHGLGDFFKALFPFYPAPAPGLRGGCAAPAPDQHQRPAGPAPGLLARSDLICPVRIWI